MFNLDKYKEIQEYIKKKQKNTKIIAISKNHTLDMVKEAISGGVEVFGENRVQEAQSKFISIKEVNPLIKVHLTGPLQTNKVKQAIEMFDVFHTLDREKILKEFSKFQDKINKKSFFIQVNTGKELSKSGIYPEQVKNYISLCKDYGIKNILCLMCIPPIKESPKKHFEILDKLSKDHGLKGLSIGMSSDYLEALEFNPTYIRLGTTLFGNRR